MQPKIPLPAPAPQEGRHAGVVPSFAIQCFSPVIKSSAGDFKRESLLAWSEPLPTQLVAKAIREVLVETKAWAEENDNGVGFSKVPTGVRLTAGWQKALGSSEFARMEWFVNRLSSEEEFPRLTTSQLRSSLKINVVKILEILAKLEALYWKSDSDYEGSYELLTVSQAWRASVESVLQKEWVQSLDGQDIRFPGFVFATLVEWVKIYLKESQLPRVAVAQFDRLLAADSMTVEEEVFDIAQATLPHLRKGPTDEDEARTWIDWFVQATKDGLYRLPRDKTKRIFLLKEEGRGVFDKILYELHSRSVAAPRLRNVLEQALRLAPLPLIDAQKRLSPLLGPNFSLLGAMELGDAIGLSLASANAQIDFAGLPGNKNRESRIAILKDSSAPPWMEIAIKFLIDECVTAGCTSYLRVAKYMADEANVELTREQLFSAFRALPGFKELEAKDGWICVDVESSVKIKLALRKMLALNPEGIPVDELLDGIRAYYEYWSDFGSKSRVEFPVPLCIVELWLASMDWITRNEKGYISAAQPIAMDGLINETEKKIIDFIEKNGDLALFSELVDAGINRAVIPLSYVIKKVVRGVYGVRGRTVVSSSLQSALSRQRERLAKPKPRPRVRGGVYKSSSTLTKRQVQQRCIQTGEVEPVLAWDRFDFSRPFSFSGAVNRAIWEEGAGAFSMNFTAAFPIEGNYAHVAVKGVVLRTYRFGSNCRFHIGKRLMKILNLPIESRVRLTIDPVARTFDLVVENKGGENKIHVTGGSTEEHSE